MSDPSIPDQLLGLGSFFGICGLCVWVGTRRERSKARRTAQEIPHARRRMRYCADPPQSHVAVLPSESEWVVPETVEMIWHNIGEPLPPQFVDWERDPEIRL